MPNQHMRDAIARLPQRHADSYCQFCGDPCYAPDEAALSMHADCYAQAEKLMEEDSQYIRSLYREINHDA